MPAQPIHVMRDRVGIEPRRKPATATTAMKIAVHAPCELMALSAAERDTMAPDAAMTITIVGR